MAVPTAATISGGEYVVGCAVAPAGGGWVPVVA